MSIEEREEYIFTRVGTTSRLGGADAPRGGIWEVQKQRKDRGFCGTQQVKSTPLLYSNNRYACLEENEINDSPSPNEPPLLDVPNPKIIQVWPQKWEHRLPCQLIVAATPSKDSLQLQVEIQSTDTEEVKAADALLDSGATGLFLDADYIRRKKMNTRELTYPIPVNNVDGTPNNAGPIREVVDTILCYNGHSERVLFTVTSLGKQEIILGLPWLHEHNPEVNWTSGWVDVQHAVGLAKMR
jgi:hypothetical protein